MKGGIMYSQRDIVLIPFPYTDLTASKLRPAVIISNNELNDYGDFICCLVTSNENSTGLIIEKKDFENGSLPFKSWVKPYRIFTINGKIIRKKLCRINIKSHGKIISFLCRYLKC